MTKLIKISFTITTVLTKIKQKQSIEMKTNLNIHKTIIVAKVLLLKKL